MELSELQAKRDKILSAMTGARSVTVEGRSITNHTPAELQSALQQIDAEIARLQNPQSSRVFVIQSDRGI